MHTTLTFYSIMKIIITIVVAVLAFAAVAVAQPRALGVRAGYGAELSYQHTLGGANFGELDLGWGVESFTAALAYDFVIPTGTPLNFYVGPQVSTYLYNLDDGLGFGLGAGAQLGLEYMFSFPLQLSLDWRPTFQFIPGTAFGWHSIALGIRYKF